MKTHLAPLLFALALTTAPVASGDAAAQKAPGAEPPFALVMIDRAAEERFGFPVDRALVAQAVERLAHAGAKAVVLKFFYDQPAKNPASDAALAAAMRKTKVLLQARIDDAEPQPNALPARFAIDAPPGKVAVAGLSGWIPLPAFAAVAHNVGFVDNVDPDKVPVYERYLDRNVASLSIATLAVALGDPPMTVRPGESIALGGKRLAVDASNQARVSLAGAAQAGYLPFQDLIDNRFAADAVKNKVVVIGYDGKQMHTLQTAAGPLKAHRVFWAGVLDLWRQLR